MAVHCEIRNCSACGREISRDYYETHGGVCCDCLEDARGKRTHPGFLSDDEVEPKGRKTEEMAKDIVCFRSTANAVRSPGVARVGETDNFLVDFSEEEGLVFVYGKEVTTSCRFKLSFSKEELGKIVDLLRSADLV